MYCKTCQICLRYIQKAPFPSFLEAPPSLIGFFLEPPCQKKNMVRHSLQKKYFNPHSTTPKILQSCHWEMDTHSPTQYTTMVHGSSVIWTRPGVLKLRAWISFQIRIGNMKGLKDNVRYVSWPKKRDPKIKHSQKGFELGLAMRLYLLMRIDAHQMRIIRINRIK